MNGFAHLVEPLARSAAAIVVNALWEDAVIFLGVALLLRVWQNVNAATRYAAWCIALVGAVAVPMVTAHPSANGVPAPQRAVVAREHGAAAAPSARTLVFSHSSAVLRSAPLSPASPRLAPPRIVVSSNAVLLAVALWALAALLFLVRLVVGIVRLERLKRNALPLPLEYRDRLARRNEHSSQARAVRLCVSDETDVPVAVGLFDAMILIPRVLLAALSPEEIEQVYLHELAHLRRADDWTNLVQRFVTALAWFSPGVYAIARALDIEREVACDDDVVAQTGAVRPYARCLTHLAEITAWPHRSLGAPGAFVTRRGISERVERLLAAGRCAARGLAFAPAAVALAVVGALALAVPNLAVTLASPLPSPPPAPVEAHAPVATAARTLPPVRRISPPAHVHVPETQVHIPSVTVNVPPIDVRVPAMNFDMPGMNFTVPAIDASVPLRHEIWSERHSASCESACDFTGVNWAGRNLSGRSYSASDFTRAQLESVNFANARFQAVDFTGADLRHANFDGAQLDYVDFTDARLDGATFAGARLDVCDFSGVDLAHVDLSRARLDGICRMSLSSR